MTPSSDSVTPAATEGPVQPWLLPPAELDRRLEAHLLIARTVRRSRERQLALAT